MTPAEVSQAIWVSSTFTHPITGGQVQAREYVRLIPKFFADQATLITQSKNEILAAIQNIPAPVIDTAALAADIASQIEVDPIDEAALLANIQVAVDGAVAHGFSQNPMPSQIVLNGTLQATGNLSATLP